MLEEFYERNYVVAELEFPLEETKIISLIHEMGETLKINYDNEKVLIKFKMNKKDYNKIFGKNENKKINH